MREDDDKYRGSPHEEEDVVEEDGTSMCGCVGVHIRECLAV